MTAQHDHGPKPGMWLGGVVPGTTRALAKHYEAESVRLAAEAGRMRSKARAARDHALKIHFEAEARSFAFQARDAAARAVDLLLLWKSGRKLDSPTRFGGMRTLAGYLAAGAETEED